MQEGKWKFLLGFPILTIQFTHVSAAIENLINKQKNKKKNFFKEKINTLIFVSILYVNVDNSTKWACLFHKNAEQGIHQVF